MYFCVQTLGPFLPEIPYHWFLEGFQLSEDAQTRLRRRVETIDRNSILDQ